MAATAFLEFYRFKTMSTEESEKAKGEWQNGPNLEPQTIHSNDTTTKTVIIGNARSQSSGSGFNRSKRHIPSHKCKVHDGWY